MTDKLLNISLALFVLCLLWIGYLDVSNNMKASSKCAEMKGTYLKDSRGKHFCIINDKFYAL